MDRKINAINSTLTAKLSLLIRAMNIGKQKINSSAIKYKE